MNRRIIRYSEALKLKVVSDIESGKFSGYMEAQKAYGITGSTTVSKWLKKYGKEHLLPRIVRVEMIDEKDRIEALQKEIAQLKEAVADSKVQEVIHRAAFKVVCKEYGLGEPADVKKKLGV